MFKAPSMVKSVLSFNMASIERFKCLVFYYLLSIDQLCIYRLALTRHDSGQNSLLDFKGLEQQKTEPISQDVRQVRMFVVLPGRHSMEYYQHWYSTVILLSWGVGSRELLIFEERPDEVHLINHNKLLIIPNSNTPANDVSQLPFERNFFVFLQ